VIRLLFVLILTFAGFTFSQPLSEQYEVYLKNLFPNLKLETEGGTFVGILTIQRGDSIKKFEVSDDSFLTFLGELYREYYGKEPVYVSISVKYKGHKVPYNPFFQLWDGENNVKLITFSRLKPSCKQPVVELEAQSRKGIHIFISYSEVESKLLTNPPKIPVGYCF